jgi:DNA repair exonuclease SbcCD nuclease subunit
MLKVFVTGDNHIGLKYASHEQAAVLASSRITAFEGMVKTANQENCALFVITGDLFENTYSVSKKEIKTLLDALSCFNGTVVVLPGNHDYYDKDVKVWQYFKDVMASYDNIM